MRNSNKTVSSLSDYLTHIDECHDCDNALFRGDKESNDLVPKISKCKPYDHKSHLEIEKLMITDFQRLSLPLLDYIPDNHWDWLSIAQHHGLATRLLDWTLNPLAAMWFAINKPSKQNAVIWILEPKAQDYLAIEDDPDPFKIKRTKIFRPKNITSRISAQMGWFTAHYYNEDEDRYADISNISAYRKRLSTVQIKNSDFASMRRELDKCGINSSTMFPDLVGLAENIQWQYTELNDE